MPFTGLLCTRILCSTPHTATVNIATAHSTPSFPRAEIAAGALDSHRPCPQYWYQESAKDQALNKEFVDRIFEGKFTKVETASLEQADRDEMDLVSVPELAAKHEPELSLPLQATDVLVNNRRTEAVALYQGSQIVVT